jgi:hypothetical protein
MFGAGVGGEADQSELERGDLVEQRLRQIAALAQRRLDLMMQKRQKIR